jgi:hypothetical protein
MSNISVLGDDFACLLIQEKKKKSRKSGKIVEVKKKEKKLPHTAIYSSFSKTNNIYIVDLFPPNLAI